MDRQAKDDFIMVVDDQDDDVELRHNADGTVAAVRVRSGLIFTRKHAALLTRAHHNSNNPKICRPRHEGEQPPDACVG